MRILLTALILVANVAIAPEQVRVDNAEVLQTGIYEIEKSKAIDSPGISSGHRYESISSFIRHTTVIPAKLNTAFGLDIMIRGVPRGRLVPFRIVWRYPLPGLVNPAGGKAKLFDDYVVERELGKKSTFHWLLGSEWALVPGTWTFEIWYEGRMLASQPFTLVK